MNCCSISSWLQRDAEERVSASGLRFLTFEIVVDGGSRQSLYVRISHFLPEDGDGSRSLDLRAGNRIIVSRS